MRVHRRLALSGIAALCVLALVTTVLIARSHTVSHRADSAISDVGSLAGVKSVTAHNYRELADDSPRDAVAVLAEDASPTQVAAVLERAGSIAGDALIRRVDVRMAAARVAVTGPARDRHAVARALVALAPLQHGSARLTAPSKDEAELRATVDPDGRAAVDSALAAVKLLRAGHATVARLEVGPRPGNSPVIVQTPAKAAADVLTTLQPYRRVTRWVNVGLTEVSVTTLPGANTAELHGSLRPAVTKTLPGAKLSITAAGDGTTIEGTGPTRAVGGVIGQLREHDLHVRRVSTGFGRLDIGGVSGGGVPVSRLPGIRRDLAGLKPALPRDCEVRVALTSGDVATEFGGTQQQLGRIAPKMVAASKRGYAVSWVGTWAVTVSLPTGATGTASIAKAMAVARSMPWPGTLLVEFVDREEGSTIRLWSSATGVTDSVEGAGKNAAAVKRAWNATATRGAAS